MPANILPKLVIYEGYLWVLVSKIENHAKKKKQLQDSILYSAKKFIQGQELGWCIQRVTTQW